MQTDANPSLSAVGIHFQYLVTDEIKFYQNAGAQCGSIKIVVPGGPPLRQSLDMRLVYERPDWVVRLEHDDPATVISSTEAIIKRRFMQPEEAEKRRTQAQSIVTKLTNLQDKLKTCNLLLGRRWEIARTPKKEDAVRQAVPATLISYLFCRTDDIEGWLHAARQTERQDIERRQQTRDHEAKLKEENARAKLTREIGLSALQEIARLHRDGLLEGSNMLVGLLEIARKMEQANIEAEALSPST